MHEHAGARKGRTWLLAAGALCVILALGIFAILQSADAQNAKRNAIAARHEADAADARARSEHARYEHERDKANDGKRWSRENAEQTRRWAAQARRDEERAERARRDAARDRRLAEEAWANVGLRSPAPRPGYPAEPRRRPPYTAQPEPAPAVAGNDNEACRRALIYETTAASNWVSHQVAYDAAVSGLSVNVHCAEPRRSVNRAYLLAMRAPAEYALRVGDWKSDLALSDTLLEQCAKQNSYRGTAVATDCVTQKRYNDTFRQTTGRQAASQRTK